MEVYLYDFSAFSGKHRTVMKNTRILIALIFVMGLFAACTNVSETTDTNDGTDSTDTDTEEVKVNEIPPDPAGDWPPHTYGSSGLNFVKLGDTITFRQLDTDAPIRDTVFIETTTNADGTEEEIDWNVQIVEFEDGRVLLETDFDTDAYLNRIRIESPSFKHVHTGIHVGSTVKDLKDAYGDLHVRPFPEYGVIELIPDNHNIFHIEATETVTDDPDTWELSKISDDLKVVRIVVM